VYPHVDTTLAPEYRGHPPRSHLVRAERGNPLGVWRQASRPFRKDGTSFQEDRTVQEAKAGSRKAREIHNLPDRATTSWRSPARKGADVDRVSDPKSTVMGTNRRKS
jgi:hypothetical protein